MSKRIRRPSALLFAACLLPLLAGSVRAEEQIKSHLFHARFGMLTTSLSGGGASSTNSVTNTIDLEYESLRNSRSSTTFRAILAHSLQYARTMYSFMGVGRRWYFKNSNALISRTSGSGFDVEVIPKRRFYYGVDVGVSQGVIITFADVLSANTTMLDFSACIGYMRQISGSLAFDIQAGMGYGYGFSGVAAAGTTQRLLLGIAYAF